MIDDGTALAITEWNSTASDVVIESSINGIPVKRIEGEVFYENENITSVTIPASVTVIY